MKAREEMPLLRCALGPTGRPFGDGLHSVTASGTDGRKAVITRNWDMAGSTLKKPIRGRKMGVGAFPLAFHSLPVLLPFLRRKLTVSFVLTSRSAMYIDDFPSWEEYQDITASVGVMATNPV